MAGKTISAPGSGDRIRTIIGSAVFGPLPRIASLAIMLVLELLAICGWFELDPRRDFHGRVSVPRSAIVFAMLVVTLAFAKARRSLQGISVQRVGTGIELRFLTVHFAAVGAFALISFRLFPVQYPGTQVCFLAAIWLCLGTLAIASAALALAPPAFWRSARHATGNIWVYALLAGLLAPLLGRGSQLLWMPATRVTFTLVKSILGVFTSGITADAATQTIGTRNFSVQIVKWCSGLEGAGLMVVTGSLWLWLFRREFRFPRALLVIPVGVGVLYALNVLRIAALILIGSAGEQDIAVYGFHSQAGWIAFNGVAICIMLATPRIRWMVADDKSGSFVPRSAPADPNSSYLMPLLTILIVAMISRAASAQFEWSYPLRFFAALAVLWRYRSDYSLLDWKLSWASLLGGSSAFVIWVALDRVFGKQGSDTVIGPTLAGALPAARNLWIAIRVLASVVTVPIAEELAFRGFLLRRIVSPAFLSVECRNVTLAAILISSVAFGALHGDRWLAGTIAGVFYALMFLWRGRVSDAVLAHATTNALLAGYVVLWAKWSLW